MERDRANSTQQLEAQVRSLQQQLHRATQRLQRAQAGEARARERDAALAAAQQERDRAMQQAAALKRDLDVERKAGAVHARPETCVDDRSSRLVSTAV